MNPTGGREATATYSEARRAELLSAADAEPLVDLAEQVLAACGDLRVVVGPELGMVMLQVREPVAEERFYLTEVLITRAEVEFDGAAGWAMRAGDDGLAALAAAVLDAAAGSGHLAAVESLCAATEHQLADARNAELAALAPTTVQFSELDR